MLLRFPKGYEAPNFDQVKNIVDTVSEKHFAGNVRADHTGGEGRSIRFLLRVRNTDSAGMRRSASGRKTIGVTWEAHKLIMDALFKRWPHMTLVSALATYRGEADYQRSHKETFNHNAGSMMRPAVLAICNAPLALDMDRRRLPDGRRGDR